MSSLSAGELARAVTEADERGEHFTSYRKKQAKSHELSAIFSSTLASTLLYLILLEEKQPQLVVVVASCIALMGSIADVTLAQLCFWIITRPDSLIEQAVMERRDKENKDSPVHESLLTAPLMWGERSAKVFAKMSPPATMVLISMAVFLHYPDASIMRIAKMFAIIASLAWVMLFTAIASLWV